MMKVLDSLEAAEPIEAGPVAATIGVYDGVHLGHRRVIEETVRSAERIGGASAVISFDPHPLRLLSSSPPPLLTSRGQKIRLLAELGIDYCVLLPFTNRLALEEPEDFVTGRVMRAMNLRSVCVGPRFAFGRHGRGNADLLRELGARCGFDVTVVEGVRVRGRHVSSTAVRRMIAEGDLAGAALFLGRPYAVEGRVGKGKSLGRKLGVPTANLDTDGAALPPPGVYAARALWKGALRDGILNIDPAMRVELHLFDFNGDLYGEVVEVIPGERIREERKFRRVEDLAAQIRSDIEIVRRILHNRAESGSPRSP